MKKILICIFLFLPVLFFNSCASYGREIAYANFSNLPEGSVETDGYNINGSGWDNNPGHKNGLKLLNKGAFFSSQFYLDDMPEKAFLSVEHASLTSLDCINSGYSPVTIKLNNMVIVSNFSPSSHSYTTKSWNVTNLLKTGENEISWTAENLCSSYSLRNWQLFDAGQSYYTENYDVWYRSYHYQPRYFVYKQKRFMPYYQPRYYIQNKNRNKHNNQQKNFEHKQKQNDRKHRGKK